MGNIIVMILLFLIVGFSLKQVIADSKKDGCSGCGSCSSCGGICAPKDAGETEASGVSKAEDRRGICIRQKKTDMKR